MTRTRRHSVPTILYGFARRLAANRRAQTIIEYALLAGFVALVVGAVMPRISDHVEDIFRTLRCLLRLAARGGRRSGNVCGLGDDDD